jgi:hypothetical protein
LNGFITIKTFDNSFETHLLMTKIKSEGIICLYLCFLDIQSIIREFINNKNAIMNLKDK